MKIYILAAALIIAPSICIAGSEAQTTKEALSKGAKCTAVWSNESSKFGQKTQVFDVRELNGETQYRVYHSPENGRIWTWHFRIDNILCK